MTEYLHELEVMRANWKKGILSAAKTHLGDGSLERWGGLNLVFGKRPNEKEMVSAECRRRLAASLFKNAYSMAQLGQDVGTMAESHLTAKQASGLEMQRRNRVSLLDPKNAEELHRLDSLYSMGYLAGLSLLNASKLENQRRRRVSLLNHENAKELHRLDSLYSMGYLAGLSLEQAASLEMKRRSGRRISTKAARVITDQANARDSAGAAGVNVPAQTTLQMGEAIVRSFEEKYDPTNENRRSGGQGGITRILFSDCFPRSTPQEVQDWESARIKIVESIDERGTQTHRNNVSAAHVPTAYSNYEQLHKLIVDALESQLPGVYSSQNFRAKDKDTLTALIKAHGDSTFSTSGLSRDKARKKIMDTYHIIKTNVVIKTVRELSQNDRVAIATYIILSWYSEYRA